MSGPNMLNQGQIEDLKEIGNIGAGRAAARLSEMIHHRCVISLTQAEYLDAQGIKTKFAKPGGSVVGLITHILGGVPAWMIILIESGSAKTLLSYITGHSVESMEDFDRDDIFSLKQLGSHIAWSYSTSVSGFLKLSGRHAMPEMIKGGWPAVMDALIQRMGAPAGEQLAVHSTFFDPEKTFEGRYLYILEEEAQKTILQRIGLMMGG